MSNVYESIMTGLTEALTDAQNNGNGEVLVRHTVELLDNMMMLETETASVTGNRHDQRSVATATASSG